jgi:NAD(P)-dependent dehydrogenase (short-subunit alcohol dehydrogenase family)
LNSEITQHTNYEGRMPTQEKEDQVAVIVGAATGIGLETAKLMAGSTTPLLLCDLNGATLEAEAAALRGRTRVDTLIADVADGAFTQKLIEALGGRRVSALVHCAGLPPSKGTPARILEVNLGATISVLNAVLPHMAAGSAAVLLASTAGHLTKIPVDAALQGLESAADVAALTAHASDGAEAYQISKRGQQVLVRRRAAAFGRQGARIVSISPGVIETGMGREAFETVPFVQQMIANSPLARIGKPEEVAALAVFLCSPAASFLTGIDVIIDGGQTAAMRG